MSGRNPPSYCTLALIAMQGHQQKGRQTNTSSNNKDKSDTIIETSTAEDHDDENLHNPSTRPRYSPGSRRRAVGDIVVVVVFTLTDRASTIPSNIRGCQSGTWSQRGTKVNGSHHGDNPLLRPTGIQIATKSYATLQAMSPINSKTVHQTSFTPYREQPQSTQIVVAYPRPAFSATNRTNTFQPVLINNSKFLKATHRTKIRKIEIPRSMVVEALSC